MCLRMDVLTVRRRKRRKRRWEGGGDSATVAVHQQRWDYSHSIVCWLEMGDGATVGYTHFAENISICSISNCVCTEFRTHLYWSGVNSQMRGIKKVKQPDQCIRLSFWDKPFLPAVLAEGQLHRPTLPQLPRLAPETERPTVGYSMCVISADPDAPKHWLPCDCTAFPE